MSKQLTVIIIPCALSEKSGYLKGDINQMDKIRLAYRCILKIQTARLGHFRQVTDRQRVTFGPVDSRTLTVFCFVQLPSPAFETQLVLGGNFCLS